MAPHTNSLLEAVYHHYVQNKGAEKEKVDSYYQKLHQHLQEFSWQKQNSVECAVNELCAEIEHIAFLDGICVGAKLFLEMME